MLWVTRFVASAIGEPALLMPGQCRTWQKEHMKTECDQPQHMLTRTSRGLFTDTYQPPACRTYQRRRAACPRSPMQLMLTRPEPSPYASNARE
eukprot:scaffold30159_cov69-Phaeocystis_antarctica.AAC.2